MIGIVIPSFNRLPNLKLCILTLEQQVYNDFELIIADDGSTDGTREFIEQLAHENFWKNKIRWIGCGPNKGVRTGRARNIGAANLSSKCKFLVMLDSDVILGPETIYMYASYIYENPHAIILGRTDWLPKIELEQIQSILLTESASGLKKYIPEGEPVRVEGTFIGRELRESIIPGLWTGQEKEGSFKAQFALPLNSCYPLDIYWAAGGHNESLSGYGFQDMVFGCHVEKLGARFLASSKAWALHIWHPKIEPQKRHFEAQKNLNYLIKNFESNSIFDGEIDWKVWWHYQAERGAFISLINDKTWVVNSKLSHRLYLPEPTSEWLERLNLNSNNLLPKELTYQAKDMGIANLTGIE